MGRIRAQIKHYEVQILEHGQKLESAFEECKKHKLHQHYMKVNDLTQLESNDSDLIDFITIMCNLTAMIELPLVRCGSGFVQKVEIFKDAPCPCQECQGRGEIKWGKVTLTTALHVLEKETDAAKSEVRLFFDSEDSTYQGKIIYGLKSHSRDDKGDWCALVCVTHDLDLLILLEDKLKEYWKLGRALKEKYQKESENLVVVVVSHPHGGPKRISVGEAKVKDSALEVRDDQDWCYYSYDAVTCDGSSGAPVYVLGRWNDGFGYWFGHTHNHSGIDSCNCSRSTVGVDSTFGQLKPPSSINFNDSVIQSATATNRSSVTMIKHIDDAASGSRLANDDTVYDENNNALKANTHTQSLVSFSQSRSNGIKKVTFEVMFGKLCYI